MQEKPLALLQAHGSNLVLQQLLQLLLPEGSFGLELQVGPPGQTALKAVGVSEVTQRERSRGAGEPRASPSGTHVPRCMGQGGGNGCQRRQRRAVRG